MSEVDATLAHVRAIQSQVKVPWDRVVRSALTRESQRDCAICLCPLDLTSRSCIVIRSRLILIDFLLLSRHRWYTTTAARTSSTRPVWKTWSDSRRLGHDVA